MTRDELIQAITPEIERIFGENPGFEGTPEQYAWLEATYGVTEDEDVKWQFLLFDDPFDPAKTQDPLNRENPDDADLIAFLDDDAAVIAFLEQLLTKYRSSAEVWAR